MGGNHYSSEPNKIQLELDVQKIFHRILSVLSTEDALKLFKNLLSTIEETITTLENKLDPVEGSQQQNSKNLQSEGLDLDSSKARLSLHSSFLILHLLNNPGDHNVNLDRIYACVEKSGIRMSRPSLNAKLNRMKDNGLVSWDRPLNRKIEGKGLDELAAISGSIDGRVREHLVSIAAVS